MEQHICIIFFNMFAAILNYVQKHLDVKEK